MIKLGASMGKYLDGLNNISSSAPTPSARMKEVVSGDRSHQIESRTFESRKSVGDRSDLSVAMLDSLTTPNPERKFHATPTKSPSNVRINRRICVTDLFLNESKRSFAQKRPIIKIYVATKIWWDAPAKTEIPARADALVGDSFIT